MHELRYSFRPSEPTFPRLGPIYIARAVIFAFKMPSLEEVSYSEAACVAAISKYFKFLIAMYVDEDEVEWPPSGG